MTFSGAPSRSNSSACAWRSWCGAKRPGRAARRRSAEPVRRRAATRDLACGRQSRRTAAQTGICSRACSHGSTCSKPHHADLSTAATLAASNEHRATPAVEVKLGQIERFLDPQPGAPEHSDQSARAVTVQPVAAATHDGDDLLGARRVGRAQDRARSLRRVGLRLLVVDVAAPAVDAVAVGVDDRALELPAHRKVLIVVELVDREVVQALLVEGSAAGGGRASAAPVASTDAPRAPVASNRATAARRDLLNICKDLTSCRGKKPGEPGQRESLEVSRSPVAHRLDFGPVGRSGQTERVYATTPGPDHNSSRPRRRDRRWPGRAPSPPHFPDFCTAHRQAAAGTAHARPPALHGRSRGRFRDWRGCRGQRPRWRAHRASSVVIVAQGGKQGLWTDRVVSG